MAKRRLNEFRSAGFKIALDDFGTGYSSMSYLHELPIDILKIDKSFVDNLAHDHTIHSKDLYISVGKSL